MRVVFSFPHVLGAPGIGWTAWNQVEGLTRAGHEVHVVAAGLARPVEAASVTLTLSVAGRRIPHRAVGRDRAFVWHDRRAARRVRALRPDVVHLWPLGAGAAATAGREVGAAVLREAPNTHTAHAWRVVAAEVARLGLDDRVRTAHTANAEHLRMEQAEWDAATAILAPSEPVADSFRAAGFADDRILRHRYGYRPGSRRIRPRTGDRPLRAVYVGLGEPRKGLHHALAAWKASTASRAGELTVVGRMLPGYADLLRDDLGLPGVRTIGFSEDVASVLAASDVLLLPTLEEGSALVTYEAQGAGCIPLVSSAAGADLEDGVHGFVHTPGDVDALRGHLDVLDADPALRTRMSAACLEHAPALTWEVAAARLGEAYALARGIEVPRGHEVAA